MTENQTDAFKNNLWNRLKFYAASLFLLTTIIVLFMLAVEFIQTLAG